MVLTMEETTDTQVLTTYALWGSGILDPRNAEALLEPFVPHPDEIGFIYRPDRIPRDQAGLRTAVDWFDDLASAGNGSTTPSEDLLASLIDAQGMQDDVVLLALWPEAPTREDFAFIRTFEAAGIPVLDLSRALDDLDLSLYTEPDPPKEAKAKAEPKKRGAKKLSDPEEDIVVTGPDYRDEGRTDVPFSSPAPEAARETLVVQAEPVYSEVPENIDLLQASLLAALGPEIFSLLDGYINAKIRQAMVHRTEPVAGLSPGSQVGMLVDEIRDRGLSFDELFPREAGIDVDGGQYYADRERNIRPAEGRPRRGETVVILGPLELEVAKKEGRYRG
jgi:hypothetical protein